MSGGAAASIAVLMKKGVIGNKWMPIMAIMFAIIGIILIIYNNNTFVSGVLAIIGGSLLFTGYVLSSNKTVKKK